MSKGLINIFLCWQLKKSVENVQSYLILFFVLECIYVVETDVWWTGCMKVASKLSLFHFSHSIHFSQLCCLDYSRIKKETCTMCLYNHCCPLPTIVYPSPLSTLLHTSVLKVSFES